MKIGTDAMVFGAFIDAAHKYTALDIGTGTGVLSLMVAQKNPEIQIQSIEIEPNAFGEARLNFQNSPFSSQLTALHADFVSFPFNTHFDLIFSNPPYFENASKSGIGSRDLARHDDSLPLHQLFVKVSELLADDGRFWLVLPHLTMDAYYAQAIAQGLYPETEISVFGKTSQLVRKITAFSKIEKTPARKDFIIREPEGTYTEMYKKHTEAYHFNVLK